MWTLSLCILLRAVSNLQPCLPVSFYCLNLFRLPDPPSHQFTSKVSSALSIYRTIFFSSLTCLGLFLQLLPLPVAPISWSLTPFISHFLFILTSSALLSRIPFFPGPFFMLWILAFHLPFHKGRPQFCWSFSSISVHVCLCEPFLGSNL